MFLKIWFVSWWFFLFFIMIKVFFGFDFNQFFVVGQGFGMIGSEVGVGLPSGSWTGFVRIWR